MNKTKILLISLIGTLILLNGCENEKSPTNQIRITSDQTIFASGDDVYILTICNDGVVCYRACEGIACGMGCVTDETIVNKYCSIKK